MGYREIIEEDDFNRITEQNIKFLDEISQKMKQGDISIFAGAGLSIASGYVDWKKLLEPISKQLRLNPNIDLTEIAQYYEDKFGRQGLNSLVFNEFDKIPKNNENINWLSKMPISEYWTTNYDHVIEQAIKKQGKSYQKLVKKEDFKYHKIGREVAIYKMHGDKDSPDDVVLTKEDYQNYDIDRGIFTRMLSVELIRKSFVFIGFSFNDPNLERILSIAKQTLQGKAPQTHYCFMRKVQLIDYLNEHNRLEIQNIEKYIRDNNYQILRCNSMVKYGIQTILINDYDEITLMLKHLYNKYITNNVFISGGINPANLSDYGTFKMVNDTNLNLNSAESFLTMLGRDLVDNGFHIYTGFGAGVGNYVLAGVLQSNKNRLNGEVINDDIHISSMMSVMDLEKKNRMRLLEYCQKKRDDKDSQGELRTYQLYKKFFKNVQSFLLDEKLEVVDMTTLWIPIEESAEEGKLIGEKVDICELYAEMYESQRESFISQNDDNSRNDFIEKIDGQKLKQNFSLKVTNVARTAHEGKINSIPTSLRNKTTEWVKKKLEDIADYIEDYSYKNNTFPVGFENNLLIQLYSEVVDLYMQNPKSEISVKQYETYKKFARIVNQSVSSKGE